MVKPKASFQDGFNAFHKTFFFNGEKNSTALKAVLASKISSWRAGILKSKRTTAAGAKKSLGVMLFVNRIMVT